MMLIWLAALAQETPSAFLHRIYAQYRHSEFSPLDHPATYFASALTAAIREDERLAKGEVGYLDGDPLCDCQDYGKLTAAVRSLSQQTGQSARARVHLDYGTGETRDLSLKLVLTRGGWRVADVGSKEEPSLLHALQAANRKQRTRH